jgi:hypothetical protein
MTRLRKIPLACLLHLANNIAKEMVLSYPPEEAVIYNQSVLKKLRLTQPEAEGLRE